MNNIKRTKFNICLLGESQVGKTCMTSVFIGQPFDEHSLTTLGLENVVNKTKIDGQEYTFKIFDTAGQERYKSIAQSTIQISDGFLIVFDVNLKSTFDRVIDWINFIDDRVNMGEKVLILVGNKIDKEERQVSSEEATNFAKNNNMKYFETSAKTGTGIKEAFNALYQDVYIKCKSMQQKGEDSKKLSGNNSKKNRTSWC
mgnify:CR=1 FL=1